MLKLKDLSTSVYLKIVETFPWCVISQSVHRILGHGWERVQMNHNMGLGDISEEGLEALNKSSAILDKWGPGQHPWQTTFLTLSIIFGRGPVPFSMISLKRRGGLLRW